MKKFISYDNLHEITINKENNIAWFNIDKFDENNCKTFLLTLKEVIDFINENNIKNIKHYVTKNDIEYFKYSYSIQISEDLFVLTTPIDKFINEMISVFNIQKI